MAVFKCKMCGGELTVSEGVTVAECEYCGTKQTLPKANEEVIQNLFNRANTLRLKCEFDKAEQIYEKILQENDAEPEAHWGLVLCKYGIEYVEDPKTYKRIPTCHRTSYDAVTADVEYLAAVKYADIAQQSLYEAEAKAIDEIQKNILNIVKNEKPFDVFLCYKETDENGKRTIDSTIANDIYYQLTQEGLKVFYAPITLEDKVGEYEPYIFAALNSAKVMLVIGTKPQYFTGVWVKNEWSRFLKQMKTDRTKQMIPCYKDMDAYDLPEEFAHLQAQDMGKIGFINDVVRGIRKVIIGNEQKVSVSVASGGESKITSLLDRGNMALEDADWDKADSFFEDVLNNDSKNAQAYLGKTLAEEKCRTLDALIRKLKGSCQQAQSVPISLPEDTAICVDAAARLNATLQKYYIKIYAQKEELRNLYDFDLRYFSTVASRKQQRQEIENWWKNHKWLSRAEKFATDQVAQTLKQAHDDLFSELDARIAKAQQEEKEEYDYLLERYAAKLDQADEAARGVYERATEARESAYMHACAVVDSSKETGGLNRAMATLVSLDDYKDSKVKVIQCQKKIQEITENQKAAKAAEIERQRAEVAARAAKKARTKALKITSIVAAALVVAIFLVVLFVRIIPGNKYDDATKLYEDGKYKQAFDVFISIKRYEDSLKKAYSCADALETAGENGYAAICFGKLEDYKDARQRSRVLWAQVTNRDTINGGYSATACIKTDGTMRISGQGDTAFWSDLIAIDYYSEDLMVGLKSDGTVVADGYDWKKGEYDISKWKDVVAVAAGTNHIVALKADGTVVAAGKNGKQQCEVSKWKDIVAISAGSQITVGLKADGTIEQTYWQDMAEWKDIVAISCGWDYTVGLKSDGTVVATGEFEDGRSDVSEWTDIVEICAGFSYTVGLKADGTVVAVGADKHNVSGWKNIVHIAVSSAQITGLKADGTVVAVGERYWAVYDEVHDWKDIKVPEKVAKKEE